MSDEPHIRPKSVSKHLRDRFFQRYGYWMTPPIMEELLNLAAKEFGTPDPDPALAADREHVAVKWRGHEVRMVWSRKAQFIYTLLPQRTPIARWIPKKRKRR